MFGYLMASTPLLTPEELGRYKACYCGLCRSLQERWGVPARLTLNYDMTFLVLLLQSLYEPEEHSGKAPCVAHPFQARDWYRTELCDYGADLNTMLAYWKCRDDWEDDGSLAALAESGLLRSANTGLARLYPRQSAAIDRGIRALSRLERERVEDADAAAACSGEMLGELFVWREDRWSDTLRRFGDALGRLLYVMDACMDLDGDSVHNRYNPFRRFYGSKGNEERFRDILKMLLGDCLFYFDKLPLVQDAPILKNILCVGVWTQFDRKFKVERDSVHGAGSV